MNSMPKNLFINRTDSRGKSVVSAVLFFLAPFFTLLVLELLRFPYLLNFFRTGALSVAGKWLINYIIILALQCAFTSVLVKPLAAIYVTAILLFAVGMVTAVMVIITGEPLLPADLVQAKNFTEIVSFIKIPWRPYMTASVTALIIFLAVYTVVMVAMGTKKRLGALKRCIFIPASWCALGIILFATCLSPWVKDNVFEKLSLKISGYYVVADYQKNGFLLTLLPHVRDLVIEAPEGYNEETIAHIIEKYPEIGEGFVGKSPVSEDIENINVIAIQSESLWDPTKMDGITLSGDPLKNMRALGKKGKWGALVSPVFGCNTCVPEFEFLTGFSSYFLRTGAYPYNQYVHSQIHSLPHNFKANGYATLALHTYDKYFYGRNKAYDLMGFDKFIGKSDLTEPEIKGTYISDYEVTRQIINMYESKGDKPMFLYAITMQNHGNYLEQRYDTYDVQVDSSVLSEDDLMGMRDAVQGVYDADKSLKQLTDYFEKTDDPTVIAVFGDHLPFLGIDSSTYHDTGFLKSNNFSENPQMYETPYLVWANFDFSHKSIPDRVSPAHLGIEVLKLANLKETDWHLRYFDLFYNNYSVLQHSFYADADGEYIPDADAVMKDEYKYIQHDCLSGEKYSYKAK